MTTFDERERAYEKKFAMDQELRFKTESRRNRFLGEWAAEKLGLTGTAVDDYVRAVRKADLLEKGHEDVIRKIRGDFEAAGVGIGEAEIRNRLHDFLVKAVAQVEAEANLKP
jgi:hypothetical protein